MLPTGLGLGAEANCRDSNGPKLVLFIDYLAQDRGL